MEHNSFNIYGAKEVGTWISNNYLNILDIVKNTYIQFDNKIAVNPDSYFLKFLDSDKNRIIALPAYIDGETQIAGIKWIASFPDNVKNNKNRASATLILNDRNSGYPIACLEGSLISSARTAASAVLGANYLFKGKSINKLGVVGTGVISFEIIKFLTNLGYEIKEMSIYDLNESRALEFSNKVKQTLGDLNPRYENLEALISSSDLIIFATSATIPYVENFELFKHNPTVLHISLRDIDTTIIENSYNFVDDVEHSIKANTSLHLTSIKNNSTEFIVSGIADLINGKVSVDYDKPRIYSPFGMGVLDLAVAYKIYLEQEPNYSLANFNPE